MYRKNAVRHIVRDVAERLPYMRRTVQSANWRMAVIATHADHPDWFTHFKPGEVFDFIQPLLRDAGVDMSEPPRAPTFVGNMAAGD
jgi:hypothetical protein